MVNIPDTSELTWSQQNELGRDMADRLVAKMTSDDAPSLLGPAMKEMIEAGRYGGVEVGFFHRLAAHILR